MNRPAGAGERGLGRGLGALIPRAAAGGEGLQHVPVERITPNPRQPRTSMDAAALESLAGSIREHGVLQPIVVSRLPEDRGFQLIAGERRWRAARQAGLATIPAVIKESTPRSSLEMALVENIQRRDLNALEEAHALRQLLDEHGLTQEALAQRLGRSRVAVTNTLRLLHLAAPVQQALVGGQISEGHARAILGAGDADLQAVVLERVVAHDLNVRQTEALARAGARVSDDDPGAAAAPRPVSDATSGSADPDVARLEDAFRQALGTRVQLIHRGKRGGKLVIHFFSDDELQGLYEAIVRERE